MFELSTELLPYFFVAQTLMMEGVIPWVDLSGLLIGYAWEVRSWFVRVLSLGKKTLLISHECFHPLKTPYFARVARSASLFLPPFSAESTH